VLAALVPLLTVSLIAGAAADTADRRRQMLLGEVVILGASASLLVNVLVGEPRVWVLFAAEVVGTTGWSIARPAMSAAASRTVRVILLVDSLLTGGLLRRHSEASVESVAC